MTTPRQNRAGRTSRQALPLCIALLAACGGRTAPPASPAAKPADGPLDLAELARSIDPGEVPPLSAGAPAVLQAAFASPQGSVAPTPEQLAAQISNMAAGLTRSETITGVDLSRVLAMIYLAGELERQLDRCDLDCLVMAERVYSALDIPWLSEPEAFFGQLLKIANLIEQEVPVDQGQAVIDYMHKIFAGAPRRHRWVAVRILRRAPDSEAATAALRSLATRAERDRDYRLAVRLHQTVVQRGATGFQDQAALGRACVLAERMECAAAALERAGRAGDAIPDGVASLERNLAAARRIRALAGDRRIEQRVERAHLLVDVGRGRDAIDELDALAAEHPRDARPLSALARAWFGEGRIGKSGELVVKARPLEGKELRFYELAVGLTFERIMGLVAGGPVDDDKLQRAIIQYLPELRSDVEALSRFSPGLGGVLRVVVDKLQEGVALIDMTDAAARRKRLNEISQAAMAEAMAMRERLPQETDVYRLIFLVARFGSPVRDYRAAATPIPPGLVKRDELLLMQAALLYSLAVTWRDGSRVSDISRALDSLSPETAAGDTARVLRADTMALEARLLGRGGRWPEIASAYRALAEKAGPDDKGRLHNNLGVALWESGDRAGARAAWAQAIARGESHHVASLNSAVTAEAPDLALLDPIAEQSDRIGVQAQALRWKVALGRLTGARRRAALARADKIIAENPVDDAADGSTGVVLEESFNVGVGYSSVDRLLVQMYLGRAAFLLLPAPPSRRAR